MPIHAALKNFGKRLFPWLRLQSSYDIAREDHRQIAREDYRQRLLPRVNECLRAARIPLWNIDINKFAQENLERDLEYIKREFDDVEMAKDVYLEVFRDVYFYNLRKIIGDHAARLGFSKFLGFEVLTEMRRAFDHVLLLQMPNENSLKVLGDAAGHFGDNGDNPDGDLLLAEASLFTEDQLARAKEAGGQLVEGYRFNYERSVQIASDETTPLGRGWVAMGGWCGYCSRSVAYAITPEIAAAVYSAERLSKRQESIEKALNLLPPAMRQFAECVSWWTTNFTLVDITLRLPSGGVVFTSARLHEGNWVFWPPTFEDTNCYIAQSPAGERVLFSDLGDALEHAGWSFSSQGISNALY